MKKWYFLKLHPSGTIMAIEPDGTPHVIKRGFMDTPSGKKLLHAMMRDLVGENVETTYRQTSNETTK